MMLTWLLGTYALAYFLGSIPFGLVVTRMAGIKNLRQIGSGNIGATNVMRTGHKGLGIATLLLDGGKGFAAVALARYIYCNDFAPIAGLFAVLGHIFPVWLRFKGGKGVATAIGVFFALNWMLGVGVCVIWLLAFMFMRISSVASILSIGYSSILAHLVGDEATALLCLSLASLIIYTHRGNIKRLLEGTEHRFKERNT